MSWRLTKTLCALPRTGTERAEAFALELHEKRCKLLDADLAIKQEQAAAAQQQAAADLAIKQGQAALNKHQAALAEERAVKMKLDNFGRTMRLNKQMDAEVLAIAENPLLSGEDKSQATLRVKAVYGQVCQSKFVSSASRGFDIDCQTVKQILGFLLVFLAPAWQNDALGNSVVTATKFYDAYQTYETDQRLPLRMSVTMFGSEIKTIDGVSKRRCTSGWVYTLDHSVLAKLL